MAYKASMPAYLKIARYKPNATNNGNAIATEATNANAMLALKGNHDSKRKSKASQTVIQQNVASAATTIRRFAPLGKPNKCAAT